MTALVWLPVVDLNLLRLYNFVWYYSILLHSPLGGWVEAGFVVTVHNMLISNEDELKSLGFFSRRSFSKADVDS